MKRIIPLILIAPLLGACESLGPIMAILPGGGDLSLLERLEETGGIVDDKVLGNAVKALPIYCKLPLGAREKLRAHVAARPEAGGVKMVIHRPGDSPVTVQ